MIDSVIPETVERSQRRADALIGWFASMPPIASIPVSSTSAAASLLTSSWTSAITG